MAAEVVGTAFVRIRALTTGLAKDIERGLKKGVKDADASGVGGQVGENFAKGAGEKIKEGLTKSVDDSIKDLPKKIRYRDTNAIGANLATKISEGFQKRMASGRSGLANLGDKIGDRFTAGVLRASDSKLANGFRGIANKAGDVFNKVLTSRIGRGASSVSTTFHMLFGRDTQRRSKGVASRFINGFTNALSSGVAGVSKAANRFTDALDFSGAAKKFSGAFQSLTSGIMVKAILLLMPAIGGLGSLLIQYGAAMVAQLGLIATAAAGAGLAMGAMFASTALAAGPLMLAFKHNSEALNEFKELGKDIGGEWVTEVGGATQEMLLPGLTDALKSTKELIPIFSGFGRQVGETGGAFAKYMGAVLAGEEGQRRLRAITKGSAPIFGQFARVLVHLGDIFSRLWEVALPIANQFATALGDMTQRWAGLVNAGADSGRLGFTMQIWYDRAKLVGSALGDLFAAIWNVFNIGGTSATPFFQNFADWAEKFREWTNTFEGQNKIKQVFDDALAVTHEFNGLVVDIFRAIGGSVFEKGGNEGIIGFIQTLRTDVVPFLENFFNTMKGTYGPALENFFAVFGNFLTKLSEAGALNFTLTILATVFELLTSALSTLLNIPGFDKFIGLVMGLGSAFAILSSLGIVGMLSGLASAVGVVATAIGASLAPALGGVGIALSPLLIGVAAIAAVAGVAYLAFKNWDTIKATLASIWEGLQPVRDVLNGLKETVLDVVASIKEQFDKVFEGVDFIGTIQGWADKFTDFWAEISEGSGGVKDAIDTVIGFFERLIDIIDTILRPFIVTFQGLWNEWGDNIMRIVRVIWETVSRIIGEAIDIVLGIIRLVMAVITGDWGKAWNAVKEIVSSTWNTIFEVFRGALSIVGEIIGGIVEIIVWPFEKIYDILVGNSIIPDLWDRIKEIFTDGISAVVGFITELPGKIVRGLGNLASTIWNLFTGAFDQVKEIATNAINTVIQVVTDFPFKLLGLIGSIFDTAKALGSAILNGIKEGFNAAVGWVTDIAADIWNGVKGFLNEQLFDKIRAYHVKIDPPGPGVLYEGKPFGSFPKLATGGIVNRRPGGIFANIGEGRYDEAVVPLKPGVLNGLNNINGLTRSIEELLMYLRTSSGSGLSMGNVTVKVEGGGGARSALGLLDSLSDAAYLRRV